MSNPDDYIAGWICAILAEYTAAQLLLDREHASPHHRSPNDTNHYTLGEISGHTSLWQSSLMANTAWAPRLV